MEMTTNTYRKRLEEYKRQMMPTWEELPDEAVLRLGQQDAEHKARFERVLRAVSFDSLLLQGFHGGQAFDAVDDGTALALPLQPDLTLLDLLGGGAERGVRIGGEQPGRNAANRADLRRQAILQAIRRRREARQQNFVAQLEADQLQQLQQLPQHKCSICLEDGLRKGALCDNEHFVCSACLTLYARAEQQDIYRVVLNEGRLRCPEHPPTSAQCSCLFDDDTVRAALPKAVYRRDYLRLKTIFQERQAALAQGLAAPQGPKGQQFYIEQAILTLRCPRPTCRAAFYDFEGCTALTCSTCDCNFCAWCLKQCASKAATHVHVLRCAYNPQEDYFAEWEVFESEQRKRKRRLVDEYIASLAGAGVDEEQREELRRVFANHVGLAP